MEVNIEPSWRIQLNDEFEMPYFQELATFVKNEYQKNTCYPKGKDIFSAFDHCPFQEINVVIIVQDPYHGANQANGLCFSVKDGIPHPPSLVNIFKEIKTDVGKPYPDSGNLERWADQGVLLLNATLTVRAHEAGSHKKKGGEHFTDTVIKNLSEKREGLVYLLWGRYAQNKEKIINPHQNLILKSVHPSPLSASRGFFGNHH